MSNLNVIATHIYPGLSNVQINEDEMIITVGNEILIVKMLTLTLLTYYKYGESL